MSWSSIPLRAVANLESGFGFPRDYQGDEQQEFPFFRVSDMNIPGNEVVMESHSNTVSAATLKELGARAFPKGTVIFPKIGAAIGTEKKRILVKSATFDNNVMGAVPKGNVHPKFLYYWFLQLKLMEFANPGHVPSIRKSVMEEIPFPNVAPSEQIRIVELLDQADVLRRLRRTTDAKAARILPTLFLKMFGDPATNPMGWAVKPLAQCADTSSGGTPDTKVESYYRGGIPWVKSGELSNRIINATEDTISEDGLQNSSAKWVEPGAILLAMYGATVGQVALLNIRATTNQAVCAIKPKGGVVTGYLVEFLRLSKPVLLSMRVGGAQPNISQQIIRGLNVMLPPETLQKQFSDQVQLIENVVAEASGAGAKVDALFDRLLQMAFSGELTAKWRQAHMAELLAEMQHQAKALNLPITLGGN